MKGFGASFVVLFTVPWTSAPKFIVASERDSVIVSVTLTEAIRVVLLAPAVVKPDRDMLNEPIEESIKIITIIAVGIITRIAIFVFIFPCIVKPV